MSLKVALFPFSADPVTNGHVEIVQKALKLFDKVIAGVGLNAQKRSWFTLTERLEMAETVFKKFPNVTVVSYDKLTVDYAFENHVRWIIRGLRGGDDLEYENVFTERNRVMFPAIDTIYFPADLKNRETASSVVRMLAQNFGDFTDLVPVTVKKKIEEIKYGQYRIAITGAAAAGKNLMTQQLLKNCEELSVPAFSVDLDCLAAEIYENKERGASFIAEEFKKEFKEMDFLRDGLPDRQALSCFLHNQNSKNMKLYIDKIDKIFYHPLNVLLRKKLKGVKGLIFFNGAVLTKPFWAPLVNYQFIHINVSSDLQKKRLKKRYGISDTEVLKKIRLFGSPEAKMDELTALKKYHNVRVFPFENHLSASASGFEDRIRVLTHDIVGYFKGLRQVDAHNTDRK